MKRRISKYLDGRKNDSNVLESSSYCAKSEKSVQLTKLITVKKSEASFIQFHRPIVSIPKGMPLSRKPRPHITSPAVPLEIFRQSSL